MSATIYILLTVLVILTLFAFCTVGGGGESENGGSGGGWKGVGGYGEGYQNQFRYNGVCAFDLDDTITCGIGNAKRAIDICKQNNYKIAINTARVMPFYEDIRLKELGLTEDEIVDDFYHGKEYKCSFTTNEEFRDKIAETKVEHMYTLANKWGLPKEKVILFDDQETNIIKAKIHGFPTITAGGGNGSGSGNGDEVSCGLPDNINEQLYKHMESGNESGNVNVQLS